MKFLRVILYPLVPVYALIINLRNRLFDIGKFKSKKVDAFVISVGNITVGGSGKTPMVIYLTNLLKEKGRKVGVLSRGYGRTTNGYKLVSDGDKFFVKVNESGDEIYHTVLECKVPAAVCENRVVGARQLINDTGVDTIVLDDAFQHRWIKRNLDIVIIAQDFLHDKSFCNNNLLPTGNMRENFKSLNRADAIIINRKFKENKKIPAEKMKYFEGKKIFTAKYDAISFMDVAKRDEYLLKDFEGQKSLVVSGIANPDSFLNVLKQNNIDTTNKLIFKDHKNYNLKEIQLIRKQFYTTNSHSVVTTEKDAVKLMNFAKEFDDIDIFFLKIKLTMDDPLSFGNFVLNFN